MNMNFLEYCQNVVDRLNELDVDNEFNVTLSELINGDPFQEMEVSNSEVSKLRKEFYDKVQEYAKTLNKRTFRSEISTYKTQLDFVNKRIADLDNIKTIKGNIGLDERYMNNPQYHKETYEKKREEDIAKLEVEKQKYDATIKKFLDDYSEKGKERFVLYSELEDLKAKYDKSKDEYLLAYLAKNVSKKSLTSTLKLAEKIATYEEAYKQFKDPAVKEMLEHDKEELKNRFKGNLNEKLSVQELLDYYRRVLENYDDLKSANLVKLQAQMVVNEQTFLDKKKEYNRVDRAFKKAEKLNGMDLGNFDDLDRLKAYKQQLELNLLNLNTILVVNKKNVNSIVQSLAREEVQKLANENRIEEANNYITLLGLKDATVDEKGNRVYVDMAPFVATKTEKEGTSRIKPIDYHEGEKREEQQEKQEEKDPGKPDEKTEEVVDDKEPKKNNDKQPHMMVAIERLEVVNIEPASHSLKERLLKLRMHISENLRKKVFAKANMKYDPNMSYDELRDKIEEASQKYYEQKDKEKINEQVGKVIKDANAMLKDYETYADDDVLRTYNRIKNCSDDDIKHIKDKLKGSLRALEAEENIKTIDIVLDEMSQGRWTEQDHVTVVARNEETEVEKYITKDDPNYKKFRQLLGLRNALDLEKCVTMLHKTELSEADRKEYEDRITSLLNGKEKQVNEEKLNANIKRSIEELNEQVVFDYCDVDGVIPLMQLGQDISEITFNNAVILKEDVEELKDKVSEKVNAKLGDNYQVVETYEDSDVAYEEADTKSSGKTRG